MKPVLPEGALSACQAELAAANARITQCPHMTENARNGVSVTCGEYIAAERTAREAVERKLLEYQALYRQADAEQIAAEQRLATVEAKCCAYKNLLDEQERTR